MLTTPRAPDDPQAPAAQREVVKHRLAGEWNQLYPAACHPLVLAAREAIVDLYARVLAADQRLGFHRDLQLVTRVKTILAR